MLTLTLLAAERGKGPFTEVEFLITPTGDYVAGGVPLDLTTLYGQTDPAGRTLDSDQLPLFIEVKSLGAVAGTPQSYKASTYTNPADATAPVALTPATVNFQTFAGITEASSAAFTNTVLSDRIVAKAVFKSQQ